MRKEEEVKKETQLTMSDFFYYGNVQDEWKKWNIKIHHVEVDEVLINIHIEFKS